MSSRLFLCFDREKVVGHISIFLLLLMAFAFSSGFLTYKIAISETGRPMRFPGLILFENREEFHMDNTLGALARMVFEKPVPDKAAPDREMTGKASDLSNFSTGQAPPQAASAGPGMAVANVHTPIVTTDLSLNAFANGAWHMILVNRENPIPDNFSPQLSKVGEHQVDSRIADALEAMLTAAKAEGLSPIVCSSYRSIEKQTSLYEKKVRQFLYRGYSKEDAERAAGAIVAYPGTSEHHTGLAVDIVALSYQLLTAEQADTPEAAWLHENCHRFGFILRYPENKQALTGIVYEPWHYRYVGKTAAAEIVENGLCLEEYLSQR